MGRSTHMGGPRRADLPGLHSASPQKIHANEREVFQVVQCALGEKLVSWAASGKPPLEPSCHGIPREKWWTHSFGTDDTVHQIETMSKRARLPLSPLRDNVNKWGRNFFKKKWKSKWMLLVAQYIRFHTDFSSQPFNHTPSCLIKMKQNNLSAQICSLHSNENVIPEGLITVWCNVG